MTEVIIEIDEEENIGACSTCGNPHPGMAHKCTDYLKYLLDKFGGHTAECAAKDWKCNTIGECNCGYDKAKKGWK